MRPSLQSGHKTLLCRRHENLCLRWQSGQQILKNLKVELGIQIVEKKKRRLIEFAPEKLEFCEFQEKHEHLLFARRRDLRGAPAVDSEVDVVALRTGQTRSRPELHTANLAQLRDARTILNLQVVEMVAMLTDDLREPFSERLRV